jgi:hypothetical protein
MIKEIKKTAQRVSKRALIAIAAIFIAGAVNAQDKKVAVFDPSGSVDNTIREIVREEISSIIVNTRVYSVLERQLINKVLEETKFQAGGMVDDSQISEIGKMMGANYVFVTTITPMANETFYLSFKMIDVQTARIEKQKTTRTTKSGSAELLIVVPKTVSEMFEDTPKAVEAPTQESKPVVKKEEPSAAGILSIGGKNVYQAGKKLKRHEVRNLMTNNFDASHLYNKGTFQNKNGNILAISGVPVLIISIAMVSEARPYEALLKNAGVVGIFVGPALTTTGIILKSKGKKHIQSSVDLYNRGQNRATTELNFSFTGNGFGVGVQF